MATSADSLRPRLPEVPMRAGHYESTYLTAHHPSEPVAIWVRYTVHKPPGRAPTGSIWFTLFDSGRPTAVKITDPDVRAGTAADELLAVGSAGAIRTHGATGAVSALGVDASWTLQFDPVDGPLRHLPSEWMYRAPVPRTKSTSPYPSMRVSGTVSVGARSLVLDGWRGMLGHNWGAEHAHRWIWLRGASFAEDADGWLDIVLGRIKVGPLVTPWIANGALVVDGVRRRVGGIGRRVRVQERPDGCEIVVGGDGMTLTARAVAPLSASVGWLYADPAGGRHQVRNCSAAAIELEVREGRGGAVRRFRTPHGGVYELGRADADPELVVAPFGDG